MTKLKLIGDSVLGYMPKLMLNGEEERYCYENAETKFLKFYYPKYKTSLTDYNIFCLGINDFLRPYYDEDCPKLSAPEVANGLTEFLTQIKNDNNGHLIVLSLLPLRSTYEYNIHYNDINKEIPVVNSNLNKFCKENNICFIDSYSHFVTQNGDMSTELSDDGIHPNHDGYLVLSNLINKELEKLNQLQKDNEINK